MDPSHAILSLIGFRVPWCVGAPCRHSMVRVVGCCLCLWALIILHGCLWAVVAVCALFEVVDGGGVHLLGDVALPCPSCCGGCGRRMCVVAAIDDRGDSGSKWALWMVVVVVWWW